MERDASIVGLAYDRLAPLSNLFPFLPLCYTRASGRPACRLPCKKPAVKPHHGLLAAKQRRSHLSSSGYRNHLNSRHTHAHTHEQGGGFMRVEGARL